MPDLGTALLSDQRFSPFNQGLDEGQDPAKLHVEQSTSGSLPIKTLVQAHFGQERLKSGNNG
ncbi:hypothetical protein [Erythrobacter sp. Alg231-14]|uniref:hypothetical protein n=1 Tax=Erythrobacter sp. Alg231-14 TaxID=1922225 RepID=UPI000D54F6D9